MDNQPKETMSHPPETSRWLADQISKGISDMMSGETTEFDMVALIDAWVWVRETEAKLLSVRWFLDQTSVDSRGEAQMIAYPEIAKIESALAMARKQLEEKVK